jgi:TRAP transporter TAXI family solute receptor
MFCREGSRSSPCPANSPAFALLPEIFLMKCPTANLVAWLFVATLAASDAAAQPRTVSIGTGSMSGVYQIAGEAICRLVNRDTPHHGVRCTIKGSGGSAHNLEALRQGEIDFAIVQSDVQYHAVKGQGRFKEGGAHKDLRAVFAVYPEPLTVVARDRAGVEKFEDFKGKRFNIGNPGSGTRTTVDMLLASLHMKPEDFLQATELSPDEHGKALCEARIDGFGYVVGSPAANLLEATKTCNARLIPLSGPAIDRLVIDYPYFAYTTIAGGTYPANRDPVRSFGVVATFVTSAKAPDDQVYTLVKAVFDNFDEFKKLHPAFAHLSAEHMVKDGLSAPLHPGAAKFYKEKGWLK